MRNLRVFGCAVALISLTGCGGSSAPGDNSHGILSSDAGRMGKALDDGNVLTTSARTARGIENNATTGLATPIASPTVALGKGADGKFTMTLNGEAVTFDGTDTIGTDDAPIAFEQATANGGTAQIVSLLTNDLNDLGDPTSLYYSYPIRASITQPDGTETFVYAVLGTETLPSALSRLPSANYVGQAVLEDLAENQPSGVENDVFIGNFGLLADFARGEVSGTISDWYYFNPATGAFDRSGQGANIVLERAPIVGNGYTGSITFNQSSQDPNITISGGYTGKFFGPAAEETGGAVWFLIEGVDENGNPGRGHGVGEFNSVP